MSPSSVVACFPPPRPQHKCGGESNRIHQVCRWEKGHSLRLHTDIFCHISFDGFPSVSCCRRVLLHVRDLSLLHLTDAFKLLNSLDINDLRTGVESIASLVPLFPYVCSSWWDVSRTWCVVRALSAPAFASLSNSSSFITWTGRFFVAYTDGIRDVTVSLMDTGGDIGSSTLTEPVTLRIIATSIL